MNKKMKRFFVLKNFKELFLSDVFTQDREKTVESDVVSEAESIINEYFRKMGYADRVKAKKKQSKSIWFVITSAFILVALYMTVRFV